jgi:hypothetical protein
MKNVKGENEAHHICAHIRIASVLEQLDSVVEKRKKKGCRVVHAVTLEDESPIDLHMTVQFATLRSGRVVSFIPRRIAGI